MHPRHRFRTIVIAPAINSNCEVAFQFSLVELGYAQDLLSIYSPRRLGSALGRYCGESKVPDVIKDPKPNPAAFSLCELVDKVVEVNEVNVKRNIADVDFHLVHRCLVHSLYHNTVVFIIKNSDSTARFVKL